MDLKLSGFCILADSRLAGKMSFIGCGHFSLRVGLVEKYGPEAEILVKHIKIAL
uniref:Uncharacterized protein n=1 Tax=Solanum tuberosum TaxID=4113 RepID=M1C765_SOLTU